MSKTMKSDWREELKELPLAERIVTLMKTCELNGWSKKDKIMIAKVITGYVKSKYEKEISLAYQSGVKAERKRLKAKFKNICVVNNDGDCKYWDIEKLGYSNDERKICGYAKFFPQDVLEEILKD